MRFIIFAVIIGIVVYFLKKRKKPTGTKVVMQDDATHELLLNNVSFYTKLSQAQQQTFLKRVQQFLNTVTISGTRNVEPSPLDRVYVAASAIIPIFHFTDWRYNNINEVLLYNDAFDHDYNTTAEGRNIAGMVGTGAMNRMMILSVKALRAGFEHNGAHNTGIHEFVHLLDKADGAVDGVPDYMIPKEMVTPWMRYMHQEINDIREGDSDINPYAGTNEAEFFAVLSEYFFQKPELLEEHHPELYRIMNAIYNPVVK